jgi:hypothetical protein
VLIGKSFVLAFALTQCSAPPTIMRPPGVHGHVLLKIVKTTSMGMESFSTTLSAEFGSEPDWIGTIPCAMQLINGCTLSVCGAGSLDGGQNTALNSGRINASGSNLPVTLTPGAMGRYAPQTVDVERFMPGEYIGISGEGSVGGVPMWMSMLSVPVRAVAVPPAAMIPRAQPLTVRWTPSAGAPGKVAVVLTVITPALTHSLDCRFAPATGTATIPAMTLNVLPAGSGVVDIFGVETAQVMAGAYRVQTDVITVDDGSQSPAVFQ